MKKGVFLFVSVLLLLWAIWSCSSPPKKGVLLRETSIPSKVIQETFAREGKSDYLLLNDDGYTLRLIYLCENRVYNFAEEPQNNPVLVSLQPILDTSVEKRLSSDDRRRIWACMERKVREEQFRVEELKRRIGDETARLEKETRDLATERNRLVAEMEEKRRMAALRQRQLEEEKRRTEKMEEERLRKREEEERRKAEEERKIKAYKAGEKEDLPVPSPPPLQIKESGIFLTMKDANIYEEAQDTFKVVAKGQKYDLFEVINFKKDPRGGQWFQIILGERVIAEKGKRTGWSPEEKSYWAKNKLLAWVYPGDLAKVQAARALKLNPEELQYTGKKASTPQRPTLFEIIYEVKKDTVEKVLGWVEEKNGIRRSDKNVDEMGTLMQELAKTLWPLRIQNEILRGNIQPGFTLEQVLISWGKPNHVNTTRTLVGVHEQWVYGESPFPNSYVYFENGVVKNWEFLKKR